MCKVRTYLISSLPAKLTRFFNDFCCSRKYSLDSSSQSRVEYVIETDFKIWKVNAQGYKGILRTNKVLIHTEFLLESRSMLHKQLVHKLVPEKTHINTITGHPKQNWQKSLSFNLNIHLNSASVATSEKLIWQRGI